MKNFYRRLIIGLSLVCFYTNVKSEIPVDSALANALQNKIQNYITQHSIPGISVTIFLPGDRVWSGAAGLSHIYNMTPMDTSHLFEMASITKMYTAAMIFQLKEQGLLSLDDTVGQYLPPMNYIPSGTTIRNMLKHRSGLYNYTNNSSIGNEWFNNPDSIWPHLQMINTFVNSPPIFSQGSSYAYSNTNFFLLGMIIEAITGNTYVNELKTRILIPHGLSEIYFPPDDSIPATKTPGWTSFTTPGVYDTDAAPILNDCSTSMAYAAGAIVAKPADACKFTKLLWTGNIISDSSLNIMKQCTNLTLSSSNVNGYGYGAMRYWFNGKTYYGHNGDITGFTEMTFYGTTDSIGLIISINRNSAPRGPIAVDLMSFITQALLASIDNFNNDGFDLSVFPNPAKENISLKFNSTEKRNIEIRIVNQFGKVVRDNLKYSATGNETYSIDVSDLSSGVYYVQLNTDGNLISRKVVLINEN
jgi:D-alanyl-D-alanine carboxypeptidase